MRGAAEASTRLGVEESESAAFASVAVSPSSVTNMMTLPEFRSMNARDILERNPQLPSDVVHAGSSS